MKKTSHSWLYFLAPIILVLMLATSWRVSQSQPISKYPKLPTITLPSLTPSSGRFNTKMLRGRVTLLNVWASWCPACQSEHDVLMTIKNSVPIYGINYKDNNDDARAWLKGHGNPYVIVGTDPEGALQNILDIDGIPKTFVIDKKGNIRYIFRGALKTNTWKNILQPMIEQLNREQ